MTESAAKSGMTAHFSPYFGANRTTIRLKSVKKCAHPPLFSLRPIKPDRLPGLATLASALVFVGPAFHTQQRLAARIALTSPDDLSAVLRPLLDGGHIHIAGRLAGALRALGRNQEAEEIVRTMQAAAMEVLENNPFTFAITTGTAAACRWESAYVQRIRLMWADMRQAAIDAFPEPAPLPPDVQTTLGQIDERYVTDAYQSLSIACM